MTFRRFGRSHGITFMELLVVMVNLAIIMAIAIPAFLSWGPKQSLKAAARDLRSNFLLCKMKAITQNRDCIIEFQSDRYTIGEESFFLPTRGGVAFGKPAGVPAIPDGVEPGASGLTFPGNKARFRPTGRPSQMGTVYLQNNEGRAFALTVSIAGYVRVRHWEKGDWRAF